jgi:hypothetical protein
MPTFIPAVNCAMVEVIGNQSGQPCEFTFAAQFPSAYDTAALEALGAAVDGWVNTYLLDQISEDVTYEGITVRGLSSEVDLRYDLSEPLPGAAAVVPFPAQVALCVTKRTGFTGRSSRGRMYLWGIRSDYRLDDRHINDTGVAAIQAAVDPLIAAVDSAGWGMGLLSYVTGGIPRVSAAFLLLSSLQVRDNRLDTQRRRLGKA